LASVERQLSAPAPATAKGEPRQATHPAEALAPAAPSRRLPTTAKKYIIMGVLLLVALPFAAGCLGALFYWTQRPLVPAAAAVICLLAVLGIWRMTSASATARKGQAHEPGPEPASDTSNLKKNLNLIAQSSHLNQTGRNNLAAAMKLAAERAKNKGK
jgi:hypothetical protein